MGKFILTKKTNGFHFNLKADNHEIIGTSEIYTTKAMALVGIASVMDNADVHVEDTTVSGFETLTHPKYQIYLDKGGEFRFHLKARNGEIILASEGYTTKQNCKKGIESVKHNAPDGDIVEE